jgi:hypothetical protein
MVSSLVTWEKKGLGLEHLINHPKGFVDGERGTSKGVEKDSLERQFLVLLYGC